MQCLHITFSVHILMSQCVSHHKWYENNEIKFVVRLVKLMFHFSADKNNYGTSHRQ